MSSNYCWNFTLVLHFTYRDFTNSLHLQKTEVTDSRDYQSYFVYIHISWLHKFYFRRNKLLEFSEKNRRKQRKRDGKSSYNDWMEPEFLNKLRRKKYTAREMLENRKRDEIYKWRKNYPCNRPWWPTFSRQSAHWWRCGCQSCAPAALYPQEDSWYSFLSEAESTPGTQCGWKG
jgi:hypothetical protein